ncbi:MAG: hypothetical protein LC794_19825 [Acidobacteria bacterium]|nr:hypothetical protein [Acidobacteriota bacterium]
MKIRTVIIRLLWFALGLTLGVLATLKMQSVSPPQATVAGRIFLDTNVNDLISIHDKDTATAKRAELVSFIWGPNGLPKDQPANVEKAIHDERYARLENLKQIDRVTVNMEWGLASTAYHFIPAQANGKLIIYHGGHDGDFIIAKDLIAFFLKNGFSVIGMSMPLEGLNNHPVVELERIGKVQLTFHDQLKLLKMKSGHPVQVFLTPVAVVLNYAQPLGYDSIFMTGVSGGGWTTTMYAAVDPRITRSYPAAGTLPLHLRKDRLRTNSAQRPADWGDYEQSIPELHAIANYLDLYILSSVGEHRKQLQILNKYDPCCLSGESFRAYEVAINERVKSFGSDGTFAVYLDTRNKKHSISSDAMNVILDDINSGR